MRLKYGWGEVAPSEHRGYPERTPMVHWKYPVITIELVYRWYRVDIGMVW